jgi:excinuclease UvrABC ATPase subunit
MGHGDNEAGGGSAPAPLAIVACCGLPGSGKSTLISQIMKHKEGVWCAAAASAMQNSAVPDHFQCLVPDRLP